MFMHLHTHNQSTIAQDSWGCHPIVSICPVCYFVCVCVVSSTVAVRSELASEEKRWQFNKVSKLSVT